MFARRPTPALAVSVLALVIALAGTAGANPVAMVARAISGSSIKKGSIAGNRLKRNTLTGTQIAESKLGKVGTARRADSAKRADSALTADSATKAGSATSATLAVNAAHAANADTLGGLGASAFVQGAGKAVVYRNAFVHNTPFTKLVTIAGGGTVQAGCTSGGLTQLKYVNDTGSTVDAGITLVTPSSPHAIVDWAQPPFAAGNDVLLSVATQRWDLQIGAGSGLGGRATGAHLSIQAYVEGGLCHFDVQGTSTMGLSFAPVL